MNKKANLFLIGFFNFIILVIVFLLFSFFRSYVYQFGGTIKFFNIYCLPFYILIFISNIFFINKFKLKNGNFKNITNIFMLLCGYLFFMIFIVIDVCFGKVINSIILIGSKMDVHFIHYNNYLIMKSFGIAALLGISINLLLAYAFTIIGEFISKNNKFIT